MSSEEELIFTKVTMEQLDLFPVWKSGSGPDIVVIQMEPMFPPSADCCICGVEVVILTFGKNYGIPMWEGKVVAPDSSHEWGGFTACKDCFDKYERGDLRPMIH